MKHSSQFGKCNQKVNRKSIRQRADESIGLGGFLVILGVSLAECIPLFVVLASIGAFLIYKGAIIENELNKP